MKPLLLLLALLGACTVVRKDAEIEAALDTLQASYNSGCTGQETLPACASVKRTLTKYGR